MARAPACLCLIAIAWLSQQTADSRQQTVDSSRQLTLKLSPLGMCQAGRLHANELPQSVAYILGSSVGCWQLMPRYLPIDDNSTRHTHTHIYTRNYAHTHTHTHIHIECRALQSFPLPLLRNIIYLFNHNFLAISFVQLYKVFFFLSIDSPDSVGLR